MGQGSNTISARTNDVTSLTDISVFLETTNCFTENNQLKKILFLAYCELVYFLPFLAFLFPSLKAKLGIDPSQDCQSSPSSMHDISH
jgi:hypothetical protein